MMNNSSVIELNRLFLENDILRYTDCNNGTNWGVLSNRKGRF